MTARLLIFPRIGKRMFNPSGGMATSLGCTTLGRIDSHDGRRRVHRVRISLKPTQQPHRDKAHP